MPVAHTAGQKSMSRESRSMTRAVRRTAPGLALTLALALGAGACSSDDEPGQPAADSPSAAPTAPAERTVATKVSVGQVAGRMDRKTRQRLARQVGEVVDGWTAAAYLGGDYPRRAFADSWPG